MKLALAQTNPTIGDINANRQQIEQCIHQARQQKADLVIFPELSLLGYPPKDLLLKPRFIDDNIAALHDIAESCRETAALVGFACRHTGPTGRGLHNAAALLQDGKATATYYKRLLPTYDVFDESRYFEPAHSQQIVEFAGKRIGLTICEDIWNQPNDAGRPLYQADPLAELAKQHVDLVINMSASPFVLDKHRFRYDLFSKQCQKHGFPLIYVNQVGGNDELLFDGNSCAFDASGRIIAHAHDFKTDLLIVDADQPNTNRTEKPRESLASVHEALVLGVRDYIQKCRFAKAVIGLSGGIDSALTAAVAAEALGPSNVLGVALPSRFSSEHSIQDARQLADNLGITFLEIPIEPAHAAMENMLADAFQGTQPGIAEENIQARARGNVLMALSNKLGHLLLATGNKSELAVGYCTMYGDMSGGLSVIGDVPKTMVYGLARHINRSKEIIPNSTITKPPSAELRPDQKDEDSLPPYETLDEIIQRYVEQEQSRTDIIEAGFDPELVAQIIRLIDTSEYKRRQAAPALKVTSRAFGFGRRMPIAQNYHSP